MSFLGERIENLPRVPFDELPADNRATVYGVDYACFLLSRGGEIFITRDGWGLSDLIEPRVWYRDQYYYRQGARLTGSTGTVYRVPPLTRHGATENIVVKFSRVAQDVPLFIDKPVADHVANWAVDEACFNDPFEEFGRVLELRTGPFGPDRPRVRTKRPIAIYCPLDHFELWQLGRREWLFQRHAAALEADQRCSGGGARVKLHLNRDYITLFQWVKGLDAEQWHAKGRLSEEEMKSLYARVTEELSANGFMVLDNKPKHIILREDPKTGGFVQHGGKLAYTLIDFELLKRRSSVAPSGGTTKRFGLS